MDDPNITMEEYIQLMADKAYKCGQMFDWETATYDYTFIYDKNSSSYKLISINDLKPDTGNDIDKMNIKLPSNDISIKPMDSVINVNVDTYSKAFDKPIETNHDTLGKSFATKDFVIVVTPPNRVASELCPGVLLHKYIAQAMRERPLNESFEK
uniref:Uncharacterized protein n=1 Tax=Tanacetum cinerariifolium TaxID=118510 RepID=A0A6L2JGC8_TANCI|nr:hypothetical protein [Tanacetum cinerariifolium]